MQEPDREAVKTYLGADQSWSDAELDSALAAELAAQAALCSVPVVTDDDPTPEWPANLAEALCRRVARNLALRQLPLGSQSSIAEAAVAVVPVGRRDPEIERLEAPFRAVIFG